MNKRGWQLLVASKLQKLKSNTSDHVVGICGTLEELLPIHRKGFLSGYEFVGANSSGWISLNKELVIGANFFNRELEDSLPKEPIPVYPIAPIPIAPIPNYGMHAQRRTLWKGEQLEYRLSLIDYLIQLCNSGLAKCTKEEYELFIKEAI